MPIRNLTLKNAKLITDKGLKYLEKLQLQILILSYSPNISDIGIELLKNPSTHLLQAIACKNLTPKIEVSEVDGIGILMILNAERIIVD